MGNLFQIRKHVGSVSIQDGLGAFRNDDADLYITEAKEKRQNRSECSLHSLSAFL